MDSANGAFSGLRKALAGGLSSRRWPAAARRLDRPALLRGAFTLINVVLVLLIADTAARIVWTWAQPSAGQAAIGSYSPEPGRTAGSDYRLLTTVDPFHRQSVTSVDVPQDAARETTLDLKLFGVRAGMTDGQEDDAPGSAIIRTPDKRQGAFRPGDTIMDGVTLERIRPDRVVISHRGVLENLFLDEKSRTLMAATNRHKTVTEEKQKSPDSGGMVVQDADRLMAAINARPRLTDRGVEGFVLTPGQDAVLFGELGFVAGDVLVAVNGTPLDSAERARELEGQLRTAQSVRLEIERDGQRRTIELSNE